MHSKPTLLHACPQDFLNRVGLDMEGMARSVPPSVTMLCLHGTGDKTIPHAVGWAGITAEAQPLHAGAGPQAPAPTRSQPPQFTHKHLHTWTPCVGV
jgi:hypothetical protein